MKQYRSDHARRIFREVLNEVEYGGEHVEILRYTTPSAVIVPTGWYEQATAKNVTIRIGPEDCSQVTLTRDHEIVIRVDGDPGYEIVMDESLLDRLIVAASENPWLRPEQAAREGQES